MTESEIKGRKRVVWDKTETASLIDLVFKNAAIWNTKGVHGCLQKRSGFTKIYVSASDPQHPSLLNCLAINKYSRTKIDMQQLSLRYNLPCCSTVQSVNN